MKTYHKINTIFKRDGKKLIMGDWALPEFEFLKDNLWEFTEKVDGTNVRVIFEPIYPKIMFKGKTENAQMPVKLFNALDALFQPKYNDFLDIFPAEIDEDGQKRYPCVCLYGEGYGGSIQKGRNYWPEENFVLFDININGWWLQRKDIEEISGRLKIECVPVIGHGTLVDLVEKVRTGFYSKWNSHLLAEGIVARPVCELRSRRGDRIIAKLKHKDFK